MPISCMVCSHWDYQKTRRTEKSVRLCSPPFSKWGEKFLWWSSWLVLLLLAGFWLRTGYCPPLIRHIIALFAENSGKMRNIGNYVVSAPILPKNNPRNSRNSRGYSRKNKFGGNWGAATPLLVIFGRFLQHSRRDMIRRPAPPFAPLLFAFFQRSAPRRCYDNDGGDAGYVLGGDFHHGARRAICRTSLGCTRRTTFGSCPA